MGICVARQPIFDKGLNIFGYELIFHDDSGKDDVTAEADGIVSDRHSSRTIIHSFHDFGIARVTNNKRGFIRFTEKLLLDMVATILPSQILVIELAKTILPTTEVIDACRQLRSKGYLIALDGFRPLHDALTPLLDVVDIVNVEFDLENQEKFEELAVELRKSHPQTQLLVKNLESPSAFELAKKSDFTLFQGNFFSKPTIVKNKAILPAPRRIQTLQLIRLALASDVDYKAISDTIKQDITLSYQLLRVVNSAHFGLRYTVSNIRQALTILGTMGFKKWVTLISLYGLSDNKPAELITLCMIRARFMELLAPDVGMENHADDLFLMGLMSLMDAIMDMPMTAIVTQTNISAHIATPLLTLEGEFGNLLKLIACYEQGDWNQANIIAARNAVSLERIFDIYIQAIEWAQRLYAGGAE